MTELERALHRVVGTGLNSYLKAHPAGEGFDRGSAVRRIAAEVHAYLERTVVPPDAASAKLIGRLRREKQHLEVKLGRLTEAHHALVRRLGLWGLRKHEGRGDHAVHGRQEGPPLPR